MRARADAGGAVVELGGLGLRQRDDILDALHGQVLLRHEHMLERADAGQRREVLHRVVAGLLQHEHVVAVRLVVAERDHVAIGLRPGDLARAERARRAGDILDDDVLAERPGDLLRHHAGDHVGRPARGVCDDEADRLGRRPRGLRGGRARQRDRRTSHTKARQS